MAAPYPIAALWPQSPRALRAVTLPLLDALGDIEVLTRVVLADGVHGFATPAAAALWLKPRACPVDAITLQLGADLLIQSALDGRIGQFEHAGMDLLFHLRPQDAAALGERCRRFGAALIRTGARAVWFGAYRQDQDSVMDAEDALAAALKQAHPADPLPLSLVDHVSWLTLWPTGGKVDLAPSLDAKDGVTGVMRLDATPWSARVDL